jgi:adenylate cyclase
MTGMPSERRPVTILFADLVGFSSLAEDLDPEDLRALMTGTFSELTACVEARGGTVEKFIGDAVMAIFGAPVAHEDDPIRAVDAAVAMLEAVRARSKDAPSPLQLRIGINTGLVVSGTVGDGTQAGVMGDAVNVAARLQQGAGSDEIVVAESVWRRIRHRFDGSPIGALEVKGRDQPVSAYRIGGARTAAPRLQAPFVGRGEELALLDLLWSSAVKGNAHVVSVVGEPGVGKSRLLAELPVRPDALDIRVTCGGERAFGPFLDLLERILGGIPEDLADLKGRAGSLGVDEDTTVMLAALLGLAGAPPAVRMADEQQKRQVFAGVWQFLLAVPGGRPAFFVLDDVHWADRSSLDLLAFLLERLGGASLMLVLAYRPGFDQVERTALRASHTAVRLEPLTPEQSVALARGYLGVLELPADLERIVADRAEGNPFFVEELLQALLELGSLAVVDGKAVLARIEVDVPDTVQGTILARVDRLDAGARNVLQHAAVIGRNFSTDLLEAVVGSGDIRSQLDSLVRAQLLVEQEPGRWTFKHALIQEVTYDTLLLRQRRELHRNVAEVLESRVGDDPAYLEMLAEHYGRADVPEKARRYALAAGDLAAERMGFVEAKDRYETALRLWGEGDEEGRLGLLHKLGWTRIMAADLSGARTALIEAEAGFRVIGDHQRAARSLATQGRLLWMLGEGERGAEVLERAIELLEPLGATPELVQSFVWASTLFMLQGETGRSIELAERGLAIERDLELLGPRSQLMNNVGICECMLGDPGGLDRVRESMRLAEESGDAEAIGRAYSNLPATLAMYFRHREAAEISNRGREVSRRLGAPGYEWFHAANEASSLAELGRYEDAEALARESLEHNRTVKAAPGIANAGATLVQTLLPRGRYEEAREIVDEIVPIARGLGGNEFLALCLRLEADLELARGNINAARLAIQEALDVVLATPAVWHVLELLLPTAQLLPERAEALLERVRPAVRDPAFQATVEEAEGVLYGDRDRFAGAAEIYRSFDVPYREARCRLEAGDLERARELIRRFGLENGPLGARLREIESAKR